MCDQIQNSAYDQCQPCSQYDFTSGDQYESAENHTTCEAPICCPPDCNQFIEPSSSSSQHCQPGGDFRMSCQDQAYDASCYQPEITSNNNRSAPSQQCQQPCEPRMMMPCEPCPQLCYDHCPLPRCDPCQPLGLQQMPCVDSCPPKFPCPPPCKQPCEPLMTMPCEPCPQLCYDPCPLPRCDPGQPFGPQQMPCGDNCPPKFPCPPPCSPVCSPYRRLRYVQPPRRESCKPIVRYQRPCIPMTSDTVYKKSFDFIDAQTAKSCRMPPVMPAGQLRSPCGEFAMETVTKLSFQPLCRPERTRPIYPNSPSLLGCGSMQGLTTQKHDFVPKFQFKQVKCVPRDNITRKCGCVERCTIQRLSFMPPDMCNYSKAESCKPIISYKPPQLPMEFETTQKLSYMPVCPAPKDDMPWAQRAQYCPPSIRFARDTVSKLSYQPPGCFLNASDRCCDEPCDGPPRASC